MKLKGNNRARDLADAFCIYIQHVIDARDVGWEPKACKQVLHL